MHDDNSEVELVRSEAEILEQVRRRGRTIRLRRILLQALAGTVALALASSATLMLVNDRTIETVTIGPADPSGVEPSSSAEERLAVPSASSSPLPVFTASEPAPERSSSPQLKCQNSTNSQCGPFYWDPALKPNAPIAIEVSIFPPSPTVGEQVSFLVTVTDPDARIDQTAYAINFGDSGAVGIGHPIEEPDCKKGYGPWTPPEKLPDRWETTFTRTYEAAGTYTVWFAFHSHNYDACQEAYGSRQEESVTLVVSGSA